MKKRLSIFVLVITFLAVSPAQAEDQIVATKVSDSSSYLTADGMPAVPKPLTITEIKGKDLEFIRQEAKSLIGFMGQDQIWSDFGPDSGYVSVTIMLDGKTHTINSWYPLYKDKDTIAYVNGSLVFVSSKQEKEKHESMNDEKHKALMKFLDKILEGKLLR